MATAGAAASVAMLVFASRAGARRRSWRFPFSVAREVDGMPQPAVAVRDAGWVGVLDPDAVTVRGRGQLLVWQELAGVESGAQIEGRIESFTATLPMLVPGDKALLFPEAASEQIPVTIRRIDLVGDRSVLYLDWGGEQLPVTLRELIGH